MNAITMLLALGLLLAAPAARAETGPSPSVAPASASREAVVRSLPRGSAFTSRGEAYRLLGGARAVARAEQESEEQALSRASAAPADLLDRRGRFLVFRDARAAAAAPAPAAGSAGSFPIAVNARTGRLGVVSGLVTVRLAKGADAAAVGRAHRAALVSAAPRIRAAFYRVAAGEDVRAAAAEIAKDPGVASAEIEVIEHVAVPR